MSISNKIVVTGGSGMVGRFLQPLLPNAIYLSSKDYNLCDELDVKKLFAELKPETVIHLAARVGGIMDNMKYPADYFDENVLMNTYMVKHAHLNNCTRFIAILSTCIYPDVASKYPMTESMLHEGPPTATNFSYGYAKRSLAVQMDAYNKQYGTNYSYLIPCNLFGEYDHFDFQRSHFVSAVIRKIYEAQRDGKKSIELFGSGKPLRQFMYAKDLAMVIQQVIEKNISENFNVAVDENLSIRKIAEVALKACNASDLHITFDSSKPDGQFRKDAGNEKMKQLLPSFKFTSLEEGIKITYTKMKAQWNHESH